MVLYRRYNIIAVSVLTVCVTEAELFGFFGQCQLIDIENFETLNNPLVVM